MRSPTLRLSASLFAGMAMTLLLATAAPRVAHAQGAPIAVAPTAVDAASAAAANPTAAAEPSPVRAGPPPGFVAPPEPKADETNARRQHTQPGNNAPFWRDVRDSGRSDSAHGVVNLPGAEKGVLIQDFVDYPGSKVTNAGEAWRQVRNDWIIPYGGSLIVITLVALALYYFAKGPIGGDVRQTGRLIERFTYFERAAHWVNAIAFSILAISGIVMAFGRFILAPWMGLTLNGWLAYALKTTHNFVGPLFVVSLVIVFITFVRDNFPDESDWRWLREGGGLFGGAEPPAGRFNAGEKIVFWAGVLALGFTVVGSGLVMDQLIPGVVYSRGTMQIAHMVHAIAAMFMMAMFLGHIYLGTIGMKGAYRGMKTGYVDEGWAAEHHELWYEDIRAGRVPAQRSRRAVRPPQPATPL